MQTRTNVLLKSAPVPIGAAGHGTTVPILAAVLPVLNCKEQTVSGVHPRFSNLKGVSIWCGVITYKFVSKISTSPCITPTLAADDVPSHNVPLCSHWTEQGLHQGFPSSKNMKHLQGYIKYYKINPQKIKSPQCCCSIQVHVATPCTPQVLPLQLVPA